MAVKSTADATTTLNETTVRAMTERIVQLLETKCIQLNDHAPAWRSLFGEAEPELRRCTAAEHLERQINVVLSKGELSHVAFFHQSAQRAPARYAVNATFCVFTDPDDGRVRWMFQDVHEGGPAQRAGVRPGDLLLTVDGTEVGPPMLPTFALGNDAEVAVKRGDGSVDRLLLELPKAGPKAGAKPPMAEPTSATLTMLDGGLGHLRVAFFPGVNGQRFARDLDAALATATDCRRMIIDLRGNLGGFVGSLRLMSHLTPSKLPIGYSVTRRGQERGWRPDALPCIDRLPETRWETLKMAIRFLALNRDRSIRLVTEGLGPKPYHGRVVMLVNEHTLSAGEMVASFAKTNGLATLVGTRTGGQVLGGANFSVGDGFVVRFPAAAWHGADGSMVEGIGVAPDVDVELSLPGLRNGTDTQLRHALSLVCERR